MSVRVIISQILCSGCLGGLPLGFPSSYGGGSAFSPGVPYSYSYGPYAAAVSRTRAAAPPHTYAASNANSLDGLQELAATAASRDCIRRFDHQRLVCVTPLERRAPVVVEAECARLCEATPSCHAYELDAATSTCALYDVERAGVADRIFTGGDTNDDDDELLDIRSHDGWLTKCCV